MKKEHKRRDFEKRNDIAGEYRWGDLGQLILAMFFIIGMCLDVFFLKIQAGIFEMMPIYVQLIIAIPLFIIGIYLVRSGLNTVFGEKREKLEVIRSGVFSLVRHPVYLGSILIFFSFVMLSSSIIALSIWIIIVLFYIYISRYEENILMDKLGDDYMKYMHEVPMFIPKIVRRK